MMNDKYVINNCGSHVYVLLFHDSDTQPKSMGPIRGIEMLERGKKRGEGGEEYDDVLD